MSESIGRLSRDARLLFIGLWSFADDSGRGRGAFAAISGALFPYDSDAVKRMEGWFSELEREGMVRRYKGEDGNCYYDIPKWLNHQKIEKPSKSRFPEFTEHSPNTPRILPAISALEQGTGNREQGPMEQGARGVGVVGGASPTSRRPRLTDEEFLAELKADPTYAGIDVMNEHGKMLRWCKVKRKQPTQARFVNWLNGAERPMQGKASNEQHPNDRNLGGGDLWDATAPGGEDDVPFHGDEPPDSEPEGHGVAPG